MDVYIVVEVLAGLDWAKQRQSINQNGGGFWRRIKFIECCTVGMVALPCRHMRRICRVRLSFVTERCYCMNV